MLVQHIFCSGFFFFIIIFLIALNAQKHCLVNVMLFANANIFEVLYNLTLYDPIFTQAAFQLQRVIH